MRFHATDEVPRPGAGRGRWAAVAALCVAGLSLAGGGALLAGSADPATPRDALGGDAATRGVPGGVRSADTLRAGESLDGLLRRAGLSRLEATHLVDLVRPHADPRRLAPGLVLRHAATLGGGPDRVAIALDRDRVLRFALEGARWVARLDSTAVSVDTVVVTGRVDGALYAARLEGEADRLSLREKAALPGLLARVYEWQIDFYRDVRPGDGFRLALEREVRPDGSVRTTRVLAAEYRDGAGTRAAYRFTPRDGSGPAMFDAGGVALRGAFLRSPLPYGRVTSRFALARPHPLLGSRRAHRGVDYGAPSGTPVRATGDGVVTAAGWRGGYGLLVELRHGGGIRTLYAHLSSVADGVQPGARVAQGNLLGTVGSTGLVTGAHLHYEFRVHGRAADPTDVRLPVERALEAEDRRAFARVRGSARATLARAPWPGGTARPAASRAGDASLGRFGSTVGRFGCSRGGREAILSC